MTLLKLLAVGTSGLLGLAMAAALPPEPPSPPKEPPPPRSKKKDERGPGGELKKTYDLLRRVRSDSRTTGRPEERLRDWADRATRIYRSALKALEKGEAREAREYGTAAHDLARVVNHARNAATFELDDDLPPPPESGGPEGEDQRVRRDLRRAHDRIVEMKEVNGVTDLPFYLDASKDLYNAARRDATSGRRERAGELARAAEALTHVPEHLARAMGEDRPTPKAKGERPEPPVEKKAKKEKKEKAERPGREDELPPAIE